MSYAASDANLGDNSSRWATACPRTTARPVNGTRRPSPLTTPRAFTRWDGSNEQGNGVAKDYVEASKWYEKAIAAGLTAANANLGRLYVNGFGVPKDLLRARSLLETGAAAGEPVAMRLLGLLYDRGSASRRTRSGEAVVREGRRRRGRLGHEQSRFALRAGSRRIKGLRRSPQMVRKGTRARNKTRDGQSRAALPGRRRCGGGRNPCRASTNRSPTSASSMRQLGYLYDRGIGVSKDYAQARQWYEKAMAAGDAIAMNNLGYMYEAGNGVPKDLNRARDLYAQAAALGQPLAMTNFGNLYRDGRGVPRDYMQARQWSKRRGGRKDPRHGSARRFLSARARCPEGRCKGPHVVRSSRYGRGRLRVEGVGWDEPALTIAGRHLQKQPRFTFEHVERYWTCC